jgi:uncharacterized protein DUF3891
MIVQELDRDGRALAITLAEHQGLAVQLAAAFGNERCDPLVPRDVMLFAVGNHDAGWAALDAAPALDAATGLPCSLNRNRRADLLAAAVASADYNERHHPFCGLLVSLHYTGLYRGRIGPIPASEKPAVNAMLAGEVRRQQRLRDSLARDPAWCTWVDEPALRFNFERLQFFDRLALYLNATPLDRLQSMVFERVPMAPARTAEVTVLRADGGVAFDEFPFRGDELTVAFRGRPVRPGTAPDTWPAIPLVERRIRLWRMTS